jgi:catechol 2,3-dioxygenase-like lactoylglutathione lyase family enzyme
MAVVNDVPILSGIQQLGIGVPDMDAAWRWYRETFGVDVPVLIDAAEAPDMVAYTGGHVQSRKAVLAINLQGGGGFEVWQYTSRTPQAAAFQLELGDLGILVGKMKCRDARAAYEHLVGLGRSVISELSANVSGIPHFYVLDSTGNIFEIVQDTEFFGDTQAQTAGVYGAVIGVSDIEASAEFYSTVLGYDKIEADETGIFEDIATLPGGRKNMRRVILSHSVARSGSFSRLLGRSQIELVQLSEGKGRRIFEGR